MEALSGSIPVSHSVQQPDESGELLSIAEPAELTLQRNPFDFSACSELIDDALATNDFTLARRYREHAACFCATTAEFWTDWINDELELINTNETANETVANSCNSLSGVEEHQQNRLLILLCQRAVAAVPEVEVWLAYLRFLKLKRFRGGAHPLITNATIRRACEHALQELGLHATEGPKLWAFYRHFEIQLLNDMLEQNAASLLDPAVTSSTKGSSPTAKESPSKDSLGLRRNEDQQTVQLGSNAGLAQDQSKCSLPSSSSISPSVATGASHPLPESRFRSDVSVQRPSHIATAARWTDDSLLSLNPGYQLSTPQLDAGSRILRQVNRVRGLFCRQMAHPLVGLPDLLDEYRIFEADLPESLQATADQIDSIRKIYQEQGMSEWELRKPYEMQLNILDEDEDQFETLQKLFDAWTKYIEFEKSLSKEWTCEHVYVTYLRACEDLGHIKLDLWYQWVSWVLYKIKDVYRAGAILNRAVRNHPGEVKLWLGYLQCQSLKATHPDSIRQVFLRGLRALSLQQQQRPEELLQFVFTAAECLWDRIQKTMGAGRAALVNERHGGKAHQEAISAVPVQGHADIRSNSSVSENGDQKLSPCGEETSLLQSMTVDLSQQQHDWTEAMRDVFVKAERQLVGLLGLADDSTSSTTSTGTRNVDLFNGLSTLWEKWMSVETRLLKDYTWSKNVGARLLLFGTLRMLKSIVLPSQPDSAGRTADSRSGTSCMPPIRSTDETVDAVLQRLFLTPTLNVDLYSSNGSDWYHVLESLKTFLIPLDTNSNAHSISEIRSLYLIGSKTVKSHREPFLRSWSEFEQTFGTQDQQAIAVAFMNLSTTPTTPRMEAGTTTTLGIAESSCSCSPNRFVVPHFSLARFDSVTSRPIDNNNNNNSNNNVINSFNNDGGMDERYSYHHDVTQSDSEAVSVTLDQLRFKRVKRRRRLSESETEGYSDASTDSGSSSRTPSMMALIGGAVEPSRSPLDLLPPHRPRKRRRSSSSNRIRVQQPTGKSSPKVLHTEWPSLSSSSVAGGLSASLPSPYSASSALSPWIAMADEVEESEIARAISPTQQPQESLFQPPLRRSASPSPSMSRRQREAASNHSHQDSMLNETLTILSTSSRRPTSSSSPSSSFMSHRARESRICSLTPPTTNLSTLEEPRNQQDGLRTGGLVPRLSPVCHHNNSPLTPAEIEYLERVTRATWDGHESADPSIAPLVAPVTSCMSPLRRRSLSSGRSSSPSPSLPPHSSSGFSSPSGHSSSTNSPLLLPATVDPEYLPPRLFTRSVEHAASPPPMDVGSTEGTRAAAKRSKEEMLSASSKSKSSRLRGLRPLTKRIKRTDALSASMQSDIPLPPAGPVVPRKGKHYLQLRQQDHQQDGHDATTTVEQESSTLYLSNLDKTVKEPDIERIFRSCQGLKEIRIVRDFMKRSKGFCYVEFNTPEDALAAVQSVHDVVMNERLVKVELSSPTASVYEPKTLFVSNILSLDVEQHQAADSLEDMIAACIKDVSESVLGKSISPVEIRLKKDQGRLKGYGYVDFETEDDAKAVLRLPPEQLRLPGSNSHETFFVLAPSIPLKRHRWTVAPDSKVGQQRLGNRRQSVVAPEHKPEPRTLFVKNLSFKTDENSLRSRFEACGPVESVTLCRGEDGRSKGFGFVTFVDDRDAFSGRMMDGNDLDGREIVVSQSYRVPTQPKCSRAQHHPSPAGYQEQTDAPTVKVAEVDLPHWERRPPLHGKERQSMDQQSMTSIDRPLTNADFRKFL